MKPKSSLKRAQRSFRTSQPRWLLLAGLVGLLLAGQAAFDVYAAHRLDQTGDQTVITNLVIAAVRGLMKPAPVDAQSGAVFVPEVRLRFPTASGLSGQLLYDNTGGQDQTAQLQFTTTAIMRQAEAKLWTAQGTDHGRASTALFDQVPNLQACTRGVQVFFAPHQESAPQWQSHGSSRLADGRTLYFYSESVCHQSLTSLLDYLKQAQSY